MEENLLSVGMEANTVGLGTTEWQSNDNIVYGSGVLMSFPLWPFGFFTVKMVLPGAGDKEGRGLIDFCNCLNALKGLFIYRVLVNSG